MGVESARFAGAKAANLVRSREKGDERMDELALDSAEKLVDTLGGMKGAAMKMGQLASFIDTEYLPDEYRELYQEKLGKLRTSAPAMPWKKVRKVLEEEYDEPYDELFAEIEPEAFAAASIGQVHRATLPDGRRVAVKIQYPGVDAAIRADLSNMRMILQLRPCDRAGPRRQGRRRGAQGARHRGARLRVRGAEPAHVRARVPRSPVHICAGRDHAPVTRPRARHRVRRGHRLRRDQAARPGDPQPLRRDRLPLLPRARSSSCCTSTPTRTRATTCCSTTGASRSSTSA